MSCSQCSLVGWAVLPDQGGLIALTHQSQSDFTGVCSQERKGLLAEEVVPSLQSQGCRAQKRPGSPMASRGRVIQRKTIFHDGG